MAIYHLSAKIISRKAGRSSTAAAAYRAGEEITDERTGEIHNYSRKRGVEFSQVVMPSEADWQPTRTQLWNAVEAKNKRADAQVARELVVALPDELSPQERRGLVVDFARGIAERYQVATDVAIHAPDKGGDQRNHHAHILTSTNRVQGQGFGNKARELDLVAHNMGGKLGVANEIDALRARWGELANAALERAGHEARIDHRSLEARGIDQAPTRHLGPAASGYERRTGQPSAKRVQQQHRAIERLERAREAGELERQEKALERSIIDLSGDIEAAKRERDRQAVAAGVASFRAKFDAHKLAEITKQKAMEAAEKTKADQARQQQAQQDRIKELIEQQRQQRESKEQDRDSPGRSR